MPEAEFGGETFRTNDTIAVMALMRLARATKSGVSNENLAPVIAALDEVVEQLLDPADWVRFQDVAIRSRAGVDDLMTFIQDARSKMGKKTEAAAPVAAAAGMWSESA